MNKRAFILCGSAFCAGCSSVTVSSDYDASVDFQSLKTFAWRHDQQPGTGSPRVDNDLNDQRVRRAVEAELVARGFQKVEKDAADVQVEYFIEFKQRIDTSGGSMSVGVGRSTYGRAGSVGYNTGGSVSDYDEARLTIDFINPSDGRMIWRGEGRRRAASSTNPEKITERVNEAVARILKKFPPKPKR